MNKVKKSPLRGILEEECERLKALSHIYKRKIQSLPKGYISIKRIKGNKYAYLCFREKDKVRSIYLGKPSSNKSSKIREQIMERKSFESKLKQVKHNLGEIEKAFSKRNY